jgi:hypothetical protein
LLLECKREFPFNEALHVLEVMWATLPIDNEPPLLSEISLLPSPSHNTLVDIFCSIPCRPPQRRALSCPQLSLIDESSIRKNRQHSSSVTYYGHHERFSSFVQQEYNSTLENGEYPVYSSTTDNSNSREKSLENSFSISEISEFDSDNKSNDANTTSQSSSSTSWVQRLPTNNTIWLEEDNSFLIFVCISILLAHRTYLLKQKHLDEQDISMHFDRFRRCHNAERLLKCTRTLYGQYIQWARKKRMLDDLDSFSAS